MTACLQPAHVEALLVGALDDAQRDGIHRHIDRCAACRTQLASAARTKAARAYAGTKNEPTDAPVPRSPQSGDVMGEHFVLLEPIGEGGSGVVWAAEHRLTRQPIALKVLHSHDAHTTRRFLREARIASALRHPNLVSILDAFVDERSHRSVLVMDRLHGESLAERLLTTQGALSLAEVTTLGVGVAAGLREAHALGIVHRDLKPANVFVRSAGTNARLQENDVVVLDFGIAKLTADTGVVANTGALTRSGTLLGTPHYMAPEQVRAGAQVGSAADVWALGVVLYECTSGSRPVEGRTALDLSRALAQPHIEPLAHRCPEVPSGITELVGSMLDTDPDRRPPLHEVESVLRRETCLVAQERLW